MNKEDIALPEAQRTHLSASAYHPATSTDVSFSFFFQAEDGIRDLYVTGVQTCALPISTSAAEARNPQRDLPIGIFMTLAVCTVLYMAVAAVMTGIVPYARLGVADPIAEIGRASCRERG